MTASIKTWIVLTTLMAIDATAIEISNQLDVELLDAIHRARPSQELFLLTHFKEGSIEKRTLIKKIQVERGIPMTHMTVEDILPKLRVLKEQEMKCEVQVFTELWWTHTFYGEHIYTEERRQILRESSSKAKSIVFLGDESFSQSKAYQVLELSSFKCVEVIDLGLLSDQNWIFILSQHQYSFPSSEDYFFSSKKSNLVSIKILPSLLDGQSTFLLRRLSGHFKEVGEEVIAHGETSIPSTLSKMMSPMTTFHGEDFTPRKSDYSFHCISQDGPFGNKGILGEEDTLLSVVARKINVNIKPIFSDENVGLSRSKGNWTGGFEHVFNGKADMAMCQLTLLWDRDQVCDNLGFSMYEGFFLGYVGPLPQPYRDAFSLLSPFPPSLWALSFISWLVYSIVQWLLAIADFRLRESIFSNLGESIWYCFGTILGESLTRYYDLTKSEALRILVCLWILFCFLISYAYSGVLRAMLTRPSFTSMPTTWEDVIEMDLPVLVTNEWKQFVEQARRQENPSGQWAVLAKGRAEDGTLEDLMDEVVLSNAVIPHWNSYLTLPMETKFTAPNGELLVHLANPSGSNGMVSWLFAKMSPYSTAITQCTLHLFESGAFHGIHRATIRDIKWLRFIENADEPPHRDEDDLRAMTMTDFQGIFYFLFITLPIAILLLLLEVVVRKFEK